MDFEDSAFELLEVGDHVEEVARLRVALRTEHPHQTLGRFGEGATERDEAKRTVDVLAQNGLGRVEVAGHHVADRFAQKLAAKGRIGELFLDRLSEAPCEGHLVFLLPHLDHGMMVT